MWETTHSMNDRVARRLSSTALNQRGNTLGFCCEWCDKTSVLGA